MTHQKNKTVTNSLNRIVLQHCRHLSYMKSIFVDDYVVPDEYKAKQTSLEFYYTQNATSRNYALMWHQMSQNNYETRIMFLRDALCEYEEYTGITHRADASFPELSEIPYNVPSLGTVSANKPLQINHPCNKPHLIILGARTVDKSLRFLQSSIQMANSGFSLV